MRLEDNPAYINYPGENGKVRYGEGIFVGYRYYDNKSIKPLFPFGFGLSYSAFEYRALQLGCSDMTKNAVLPVAVRVANTGTVDGDDADIGA